MIFDQNVVESWGRGGRERGFVILRNTMFTSCIIDACKIALDKDVRTPSVLGLVGALDEAALREALREEYSVWRLVPERGEAPEVVDILKKMERKEEAERRSQFDEKVIELHESWAAFRASQVLHACQQVRDKMLAHAELHHGDSGYRPLDVRALGIKWSDLGEIVVTLQQLVILITLLYRGASFAFDMLDQQLEAATVAFWTRA
jgi:hypothetical protein